MFSLSTLFTIQLKTNSVSVEFLKNVTLSFLHHLQITEISLMFMNSDCSVLSVPVISAGVVYTALWIS